MASPAARSRSARIIAVFAVLGAWSALLIVLGASALSEARDTHEVRGVMCLATGGAAGLVIVVSALLRSWLAALYGVLLLTSAGIILVGILEVEALLSPGLLGLVAIGASAPIALALLERPAAPPAAPLPPEVTALLRGIHEQTMLSDGAKRLLFRERELDLLRDAIERDIVEGKDHVALTLCDEMANAFGYREEAEAFRGRIIQARQEHYEASVRSALRHLDEMLAERNWAAVHHEAARIRRLYGDSHLVQDLDGRILQARTERKRELERQFLEAARHEEVERAMELLKELDRYLEPPEAERLAEVAQGVVVKHRDNLGVRFKLAVNDHRWAEAARIGESIIEEFPNSKMAGEVRSMIDVLRTRATQAAIAEAH